MTRIFGSPVDLLAAGECDLGVSPWMTVDQARINTFADATDDDQWIHVDGERAKDGPFGSTIAHGFLTLALAAHFLPVLIDVPGAALVVNYGLARVRFPSPLPVDSSIRGVGRLLDAEPVAGGCRPGCC